MAIGATEIRSCGRDFVARSLPGRIPRGRWGGGDLGGFRHRRSAVTSEPGVSAHAGTDRGVEEDAVSGLFHSCPRRDAVILAAVEEARRAVSGGLLGRG